MTVHLQYMFTERLPRDPALPSFCYEDVHMSAYKRLEAYRRDDDVGSVHFWSRVVLLPNTGERVDLKGYTFLCDCAHCLAVRISAQTAARTPVKNC